MAGILLISCLPILSFDRRLPVIGVYFLAVLSAAVLLLHSLRRRVRFTRRDGLYLLWLGILTLATLFGPDPLSGLSGGGVRGHGVVFFLAVFLVGKLASLLPGGIIIGAIKLVFLAQAAAILILPLIPLPVPLRLYEGGLPGGTLASPHAAAGVIAMTLPFLLDADRASWQRVVFLAVTAVSVFLTGSRTGLLSLVTGLYVFLLARLKPFRFRLIVSAVFIIMFAAAGFLSVRNQVSPVENRQAIWRVAAGKISENPAFGYGAESGTRIFADGFSEYYGIRLDGLILDRAHNLLLDVALWSGVTGLAVFTGFCYLAFRDARRTDRHRLASLSALFVYLMLQPADTVHWLLFILLTVS